MCSVSGGVASKATIAETLPFSLAMKHSYSPKSEEWNRRRGGGGRRRDDTNLPSVIESRWNNWKGVGDDGVGEVGKVKGWKWNINLGEIGTRHSCPYSRTSLRC